jgi:hypothetical protein
MPAELRNRPFRSPTLYRGVLTENATMAMVFSQASFNCPSDGAVFERVIL